MKAALMIQNKEKYTLDEAAKHLSLSTMTIRRDIEVDKGWVSKQQIKTVFDKRFPDWDLVFVQHMQQFVSLVKMGNSSCNKNGYTHGHGVLD